MEYKDVDEILYEQLKQLRSMSEYCGETEPELVISISLAMVEIAKAIQRQYGC